MEIFGIMGSELDYRLHGMRTERRKMKELIIMEIQKVKLLIGMKLDRSIEKRIIKRE